MIDYTWPTGILLVYTLLYSIIYTMDLYYWLILYYRLYRFIGGQWLIILSYHPMTQYTQYTLGFIMLHHTIVVTPIHQPLCLAICQLFSHMNHRESCNHETIQNLRILGFSDRFYDSLAFQKSGFSHEKVHLMMLVLYGDGSKPCTPGEHQNSW